MKSVQVTFILLLGIYSTYASTTSTKKGSTIIDYLKDGFDAVYKYKEQATFSHLKVKDFQGHTYDIHVRKTSQDDPKKFVMFCDNVKLQGNYDEPLSDTDLVGLSQPVIVSVEGEDLDVEHLFVTETDTKKSLSWKHDALTLLLHNMTEQVEDLDDLSGMGPITLEFDLDDMPYGKCKVDFSIKTKKGKIYIEMRSKRAKCTGDLDKDILEDFKEYNVTDIQGQSEFSFGFIYDRVTGQFLKSYLKMKGKAVSDVDLSFYLNMELNFDSFKEIQQTFDETKNTKMYKESDIEFVF